MIILLFKFAMGLAGWIVRRFSGNLRRLHLEHCAGCVTFEVTMCTDSYCRVAVVKKVPRVVGVDPDVISRPVVF